MTQEPQKEASPSPMLKNDANTATEDHDQCKIIADGTGSWGSLSKKALFAII